MSRLVHCDFGGCGESTEDNRELAWLSVDGYCRSNGESIHFDVCPAHAHQVFAPEVSIKTTPASVVDDGMNALAVSAAPNGPVPVQPEISDEDFARRVRDVAEAHRAMYGETTTP